MKCIINLDEKKIWEPWGDPWCTPLLKLIETLTIVVTEGLIY